MFVLNWDDRLIMFQLDPIFLIEGLVRRRGNFGVKLLQEDIRSLLCAHLSFFGIFGQFGDDQVNGDSGFFNYFNLLFFLNFTDFLLEDVNLPIQFVQVLLGRHRQPFKHVLGNGFACHQKLFQSCEGLAHDR